MFFDGVCWILLGKNDQLGRYEFMKGLVWGDELIRSASFTGA